MNQIVTIIPAAGSGTRMGEALPKQYLEINGRPLIFHTLAALLTVPRVAKVVVVIAANDNLWDDLFRRHGAQWHDKINVARVGGATRGESVLNGLRTLSGVLAADDWAMVHDAARPCIHPDMIERLLDEVADDKIGGLLALPVADTLKQADGTNGHPRTKRTVPRTHLWRAQTPQIFRYGMLCEALAGMPNATDEAEAVEAMGHAARLVMGDSSNIKVTYASDVKMAEILLRP